MTSLRERIAAGDRRALGEAFTAYRPLALKILSERRRPPADIDDLVQEAFLLLPRCAQRCDPGTSLGGCVATAVFQACISFDARSATSDQTGAGRGMSSRRQVLKPGQLEAFRDPGPNPEEVAELRQRSRHLTELMLQLPEREREILIARELTGVSLWQVAHRLGIKPGSVAARTRAARRRLEQLAASSPLAAVFAAMPRRGEGLGMSRAARYRRRAKASTRSQEAM